MVGEIGRGEGAEQKERGVADRDLAGEADQDVQAERGDAEDADLDQDAEPVFVQDAAARSRPARCRAIAKLRLVVVGKIVVSAGVAGAEIAGRDQEGAAMIDYTRSMSLVPNRP